MNGINKSNTFRANAEILFRSFEYSPESLSHFCDIGSIRVLVVDGEIAVHDLPNLKLIVLHNGRFDGLINCSYHRATHKIYIGRFQLAKGAVESYNPSEPTELTQAAPT